MKDKKIALKDVGKVFDSFIIIQKKAESNGPFQPIDEFEDYVSIWAESRWLRGRNLYAARAANVRTDLEFIIRYRTDIDETMRIKLGDRHFNIEGILPLDNSKGYLIIKAYEVKYDM